MMSHPFTLYKSKRIVRRDVHYFNPRHFWLQPRNEVFHARFFTNRMAQYHKEVFCPIAKPSLTLSTVSHSLVSPLRIKSGFIF